MIHDTVQAFRTLLDIQERPDGPLAGTAAGIKDLYDIAGVPTGAGSPDWLRSHPVPSVTASAVARLLAAGTRVVGKTHTDELAWSLNGQNAHYGTPVNTAAPGRIPGGSSSGSAAAVAAGLVDIGLGSDTGGSVRLPASFCGLYGLRSTHGRIPMDGTVPLAPGYDTVGWFTREAALMAKVGAVLLPGWAPAPARPTRVLVATDLFAAAGPAVAAALAPAVVRVLTTLGLTAERVAVAGEALPQWRDAFRVAQSADIWATHGAWVTARRPAFGPGVRGRFAAAAALEGEAVAQARALRATARARMEALLPPGTVLLSPVTPGIAPLCDTPEGELDGFRAAALSLLCPAGHAGLPQMSLPLGTLDGCPLGLGVTAAAGADEALLALAEAVDRA